MRWPLFLIALACAALAQAAPQPPAFRLGDVATPLEYSAALAIDPRQSEFAGEVRIAIRVNRATPVLWLNATNLKIDSAEFEQGRRKIDVNVLPGGEDFIGFEARGADFTPGIILARLRYRGALEPVSTRGLFRQQDRGEWYVVSQFEAISARRAFPCFDEPGWKTPWQLTIDAPARDVVVSNTPETRAAAAPGRSGWTRHEFAQTKPLPTYLVAMAVGPFEVVDGGTAGAKKTRLRYLTQKGRADEAKWAKEVTPKLLESLEDYFGIPYPFEKLDAVSIPQTTGFGAMENVGMITYASALILATPREDTVPFKRRYAAVAAHEIAHMWFGNLVTLDWWDDTWLNEAFASWMGSKTIQRLKPEWDAGYTTGRSRKYALEADRLASARQVRNPVLEKGEIWAAFDSITYNKGSAVLSTFETWFGAERFREGVRAFLDRHAYGTASAQDFVKAIGEAAGRGPEALATFRAFIEQPGVPLLDIALDCSQAPLLDVRQQRLRPVGSSAPDLRWTTPACFRQGARTECADIKGKSERVLLAGGACPAWLLANPGGKSYYVPRYAPELAQQLRKNVAAFSADEMIATTTDAGILAESGLIGIGDALAWASAGLDHPSLLARRFAVNLVQEQRDAWLGPKEAEAKRALLDKRLVPLARQLGWRERPGDTDELRDLRATLMPFAADKGDPALRAEARELALAWIQKRDAVPATMIQPVLDTAARFADAPVYDKLRALVLKTSNLRERSYLVYALARARDPALRDRTLALTLDKSFNGRDALDLLEDALDDETNRRAAFDFLRASYDPLVAKLPEHTMTRLMDSLGELCTREERDLFVGFFKDRAPGILGGARAYRQTLERIDLCIAARSAS
ncbi:MAG TPA: M1 family metallopeptidase [Burkholderiales bacterium]|nr:M1 family metallopeptidase [Burkholderiales bacterium]